MITKKSLVKLKHTPGPWKHSKGYRGIEYIV